MTTAARTRGRIPNVLLNVEIARERQEVARARRQAAEALTSYGLDELVDTARLLTSELVTNAVMHSSGDSVAVTLRYAVDELTISVADDAPGDLPDPREAGQSDENGRGLLLVGVLGQRWGVTVDPDAGLKQTWVCLPVPGRCL